MHTASRRTGRAPTTGERHRQRGPWQTIPGISTDVTCFVSFRQAPDRSGAGRDNLSVFRDATSTSGIKLPKLVPIQTRHFISLRSVTDQGLQPRRCIHELIDVHKLQTFLAVLHCHSPKHRARHRR